MGYNSVLECAISQIGQGGGANKPNKYTRWYYGNDTVAPWCAIFMAWCFEQVGITDRLDGLTNKAGCEPWRKWAVAKGYWRLTPKAGAIVLYDWNKAAGDGADHIGIVESITSNGIVALEGNTSTNGSQSNGGYVLRKTRYNADIMGYIYVDTTAPKPQPKPVITPTKLAGANRYKTNQAVLGNGTYFGCVLVSGESYPDALSAAYYAKQLGVPIVLTDPNGKQSESWLAEHVYGTITIIGGGGVISTLFEERLKRRYTVKRLAGIDRYATNQEVLDELKDVKKLAVVSGRTFADGLAAGLLDFPTMLAGTALTYSQLDYIVKRNIDTVYILGGTSAVNSTVEAQLKAVSKVERIAGDNRYETAAKVAKAFYGSTNAIAMATGKTFADGLSAANLKAMPLLLVDATNYQAAQGYITTQTLNRAYVVGGAVPDSAIDWALTKLPTTAK